MLQALLWAKEYNKAKKIPHGIYKTLLKFFQICGLIYTDLLMQPKADLHKPLGSALKYYLFQKRKEKQHRSSFTWCPKS